MEKDQIRKKIRDRGNTIQIPMSREHHRYGDGDDRALRDPEDPIGYEEETASMHQNEKRYCCGWFTKRGLICFILVFFLFSVGLGLLIAYLVAKSVIKNAEVKPTDITMHVHSSTKSEDFIELALETAVTNHAILGGTLLSTEMDVYATLQGQEVKVVSMQIPDTQVDAKVEDSTVNICDPSTFDPTSGTCALRELTDDDLEALHALVQMVMQEEHLEMKMKAPHGVQLRAMGIRLPFTFEFEKTFRAAAMNDALSKVEIHQFDFSRCPTAFWKSQRC